MHPTLRSRRPSTAPLPSSVSGALALAVAALVAAPASAETWTVNGLGAGADFTTIQAAIDFAAPGDTVLVAPGLYAEGLDIAKPLVLIGSGSEATAGTSATVVQTFPTFPGIPGPAPLHVHDLPAGTDFVLAGFQLSGGWGAVTFGVGAVANLSDNAGRITLSDVGIEIAGGPGADGGHLFVRNCAQVFVDACAIPSELANGTRSLSDPTGTGGPSDPTGTGGPSDPTGTGGLAAQPGSQRALHAENSNVFVNDSSLTGRAGATSSGTLAAGQGGAAVRLIGGSLRVARSSLVGGQGGGYLFELPEPGDGGPAIHATGAQVRLQGGPHAVLRGGNGGAALFGLGVLFGAGAPALVVEGGSIVSYPADLTPEAGEDGMGVPHPVVQTVEAGSLVVPVAYRLASLAASVPRVAPGGSLDLLAAGSPSGLQVLLFSTGLGDAFAIPGLAGSWLLGAPFFQFATLTLDAAGRGQLPIGVPASPAFDGRLLYFAGVELGANPSFSLPTGVLVKS